MADREPRDCDVDRLGLEEAERAALSGFTRRIAHAFAHLREAWCVADADNAAALLAGLRAMFDGPSFKRNRELFEHVLTHGYDEKLTEDCLKALHGEKIEDPSVARYIGQKEDWAAPVERTLEHLANFDDSIAKLPDDEDDDS